MTRAGGFVNNNVDNLPPQSQYPLLRDIPGSRYLILEAKRRILRDGDCKVRSRTGFRRDVRLLGVKLLPCILWNASSLIDFEHWAQVNEDLRRKGVILPCGYIHESSQGAHSVATTDDQTGISSNSEDMRSLSSNTSIETVRPSKFPGYSVKEIRYDDQSTASLRRRGYSQMVDFQEGVASQPASLTSLSFIPLEALDFKRCAKEFFGVILEVFGHCLRAI